MLKCISITLKGYVIIVLVQIITLKSILFEVVYIFIIFVHSCLFPSLLNESMSGV
jgi:hypothetical protein